MSKTNIVPISDQPASQEESPNRLSFTLEEMLKEFENGAVPRSKFWQELITALYDTANHVVTGVTAVADVKPDNIGNIPLLPKDIDAPAMVRMDGADANTRQTNQDVFGRSLFYGDACKVVHQYGAYYEVLAGEAYVAGIRFFYPGMQELLIEEVPNKVWFDVSWPSEPMNHRKAVIDIILSKEDLKDYVENGIQHYLEIISLLDEKGFAEDARSLSGINVKQFGAVGNGIVDDTNSLQLALNAAKNGALIVPSGIYKLTKSITGECSVVGEGKCILKAVGEHSDFSGGILTLNGEYDDLVRVLIADSEKGDISISINDTTGIEVNDVLLISNPNDYSWSSYRNYYRAGEAVYVSSIDGNVVYLTNKIFGSYKTTDNISVYKMKNKYCLVRDIVIDGYDNGEGDKPDKSVVGLQIRRFDNVTVDNVTASKSSSSAISLSTCVRSKVVNCNGYKVIPDRSLGLSYGLVLNNCQDIVISNCYLYGVRHGLAIGGTEHIVNRNLNINSCTINSIGTDASADVHGNAEYVYYRDCTIYNGALYSGDNTHFYDCYITNKNRNEYSPNNFYNLCIEGRELLGFNHVFKGCYIEAYGAGVSNLNRGVLFDYGSTSSTASGLTRSGTILIKECAFVANELSHYSGSYVIRFTKRKELEDISLSISFLDNIVSVDKNREIGVIYINVSNREESTLQWNKIHLSNNAIKGTGVYIRSVNSVYCASNEVVGSSTDGVRVDYVKKVAVLKNNYSKDCMDSGISAWGAIASSGIERADLIIVDGNISCNCLMGDPIGTNTEDSSISVVHAKKCFVTNNSTYTVDNEREQDGVIVRYCNEAHFYNNNVISEAKVKCGYRDVDTIYTSPPESEPV